MTDHVDRPVWRSRRRCCRQRSQRDAATVTLRRRRLTRRAHHRATGRNAVGDGVPLQRLARRKLSLPAGAFGHGPFDGRPVSVQRVDFTADDAGTRRLLKGVRYAAAQRVQPGDTIELVSHDGAADQAEIASPLALASISAIVFFVDDEGQTGIVSAAARVPEVPDLPPSPHSRSNTSRIERRQHQGRFRYWPKLTLAETSGRSPASIKKILFELVDVGSAGQVLPIWNVSEVLAGDTISLVTGKNGQAPWFEIESSGDASRVSVSISFVDDRGRGGMVSAIALVKP